jgi:Protein kinase domain
MDQRLKGTSNELSDSGSSTAKHQDTVLLTDFPEAAAVVPGANQSEGLGSANGAPTDANPTPAQFPNLDPANFSGLSQRYDILAEAGRGNMGIVYKARDKETGEILALKLLKPEIAAADSTMERFKNELLFARKITHKNVCRLYEFNRIGDIAYTSMEYVEGESLRSILNRCGACSVGKGTYIALQICAGLKEAHAQGIVHRDLKPENVMIDAQQSVKIMDFGIARSMEAGARLTNSFVGTPAYMAPEQVAGKPLDYRADIYSLGLMLYEMFTGAPAFMADSPVAVALKQMRESPVPPHQIEPSLPVSVERVILKCLEKEPAKRFQSIAELEKSLKFAAMNAAPASIVSSPAALAISAPIAVHSAKTTAAPKRTSVAPIAWIILGVFLTLAALAIARWALQAESAEQIQTPPTAATPKPPEFALEIPVVPKAAAANPAAAAPKPAAAPPAAPSLEALANITPANSKPTKSAGAGEANPSAAGSNSAKPKDKSASSINAALGSLAKNQEADQPEQGTANSAAEPYASQFLVVGRFAREDKANERVKKLEDLGLPANIVVRHPEGHPAAVYVVVTGPYGLKRLSNVKQELEAEGIQSVPAKVPELGQRD